MPYVPDAGLRRIASDTSRIYTTLSHSYLSPTSTFASIASSEPRPEPRAHAIAPSQPRKCSVSTNASDTPPAPKALQERRTGASVTATDLMSDRESTGLTGSSGKENNDTRPTPNRRLLQSASFVGGTSSTRAMASATCLLESLPAELSRLPLSRPPIPPRTPPLYHICRPLFPLVSLAVDWQDCLAIWRKGLDRRSLCRLGTGTKAYKDSATAWIEIGTGHTGASPEHYGSAAASQHRHGQSRATSYEQQEENSYGKGYVYNKIFLYGKDTMHRRGAVVSLWRQIFPRESERTSGRAQLRLNPLNAQLAVIVLLFELPKAIILVNSQLVTYNLAELPAPELDPADGLTRNLIPTIPAVHFFSYVHTAESVTRDRRAEYDNVREANLQGFNNTMNLQDSGSNIISAHITTACDEATALSERYDLSTRIALYILTVSTQFLPPHTSRSKLIPSLSLTRSLVIQC
ncbi:uncharacterized protein MYCFIDRAFT_174940 [Pseudocercospora fijiensis CIRAD86]|uniref:Uncharacterized protein n=1 Tax=Pseudocercospora fijiensis (strain CIRAD86) TaxID=383855 RepID=M3B274_PSEFD|nr:uncharacterized protein MYCFIDRAFT_174940 [Pseudocercospora fijiensis CIRAD86]EME83512.1 hypothetical protein MYCFIDRAFT_174940 [Pseudocercospora fijiensis CIRAD86]